jgi:Zn-dependent protease
VTLLKLRGIPIRAHWTLALGLPFFAWIMASEYFGTTSEGWAWGAALAVALFVSVTLHELAHSLVALRLGTSIREIILLPIGGASVMTTPPREPKSEFLIAGVGPLASLALGVVLLGSAAVAGIPWTSPSNVPHAQGFVLAAGYLNATLGLFNLLVPAFPMDGGRVLRALLSRRLGLARATTIAATVGRGLAVLMGVAGVAGGGILLVLIAVFVWGGASTEEQAVRVTTTLEGVRLADIMTRDPVTVDPSATLDEALRLMLESKHVLLPVVMDERPVGVVTSTDIARVPPPERATVKVAEVAQANVTTRAGEEAASSVLPGVVETGLVAVVDAAHRLIGIVTPTDIARSVQLLGITQRAST